MVFNEKMDKNNKGRIEEIKIDKKIKLDIKDKKILSILSEESRISLSTIAKKIRLKRDTVNYRINRLIKNNIILGFIPQINLKYFGYETFHVFMVIKTIDEKRKNSLLQELINHPNTKSLMEYHDTWDLEWVLIAKNLLDFDRIIIDVTKNFKDIIIRKDKLTIIKGLKSVQLPGASFKEDKSILKELDYKKKISLDYIDIKILTILSENSRLSSYEISKKIKVSADKVSYRIKKMVNAGIIFNFSVLVNLSALGYHWYTFCINVKTFDISNEMKFKEFIAINEFVLRAVKVLGDFDLLIYITADTNESFHKTFKQIQEQFTDIISDYQTWIAYKEHVYNSLPRVIVKNFNSKH